MESVDIRYPLALPFGWQKLTLLIANSNGIISNSKELAHTKCTHHKPECMHLLTLSLSRERQYLPL
jgi:hypothetical protein